MSKEFEELQSLLKQNRCELKLKKHIKDMFLLWLHGVSSTRPSFWNLFGYAGGVYMILLNEIIWIIVSIFVAYNYGWIYLILIFVPVVIKVILKPVGQGFIIADLQENEALFNALWDRKAIGICSIKKRKSTIHKNGIPEVIIDSDDSLPGYVGDWKSQLSKIEALED